MMTANIPMISVAMLGTSEPIMVLELSCAVDTGIPVGQYVLPRTHYFAAEVAGSEYL